MRAVDLFAGAGGFSTGAVQADCDVVWAANHDPLAVATHQANHSETEHSCQDLQQADWSLVPKHDLLLASPACQGHSRARGRAGREGQRVDSQRSTAWAVVSCAEFHRPQTVVVENVSEFLKWNLFPAWKQAMQLLGYKLTENVLNAADFGVPQSRERVFIVANRKKEILIRSPKLQHVSASTIIDWDAGSWNSIESPSHGRTRSAGTPSQIRAARERHGEKFLIAYYGNEKAGRDLSKPIGTITTKDRFALIRGDQMRMLTVEEYRLAMGFPLEYQLPQVRAKAIHLLGNAVVPAVAAGVIRQIQEVA